MLFMNIISVYSKELSNESIAYIIDPIIAGTNETIKRLRSRLDEDLHTKKSPIDPSLTILAACSPKLTLDERVKNLEKITLNNKLE